MLEELIQEMKGDKDVISAEAGFPEDNPFGRESNED
jgi:hypothetical protein